MDSTCENGTPIPVTVKSIEALEGSKNLRLIGDKSSVTQDDQSFTKSTVAKESLLTGTHSSRGTRNGVGYG